MSPTKQSNVRGPHFCLPPHEQQQHQAASESSQQQQSENVRSRAYQTRAAGLPARNRAHAKAARVRQTHEATEAETNGTGQRQTRATTAALSNPSRR